MALFFGIDLGTQNVKACIFTETGKSVSEDCQSYEFDTPHSGWAEEDAEVWSKTNIIFTGATIPYGFDPGDNATEIYKFYIVTLTEDELVFAVLYDPSDPAEAEPWAEAYYWCFKREGFNY